MENAEKREVGRGRNVAAISRTRRCACALLENFFFPPPYLVHAYESEVVSSSLSDLLSTQPNTISLLYLLLPIILNIFSLFRVQEM